MSMLSICRTAFMVVYVSMLATSVSAAPKYSFKLAHVIAAGTPIDISAKKFANLVKQRTKGEIEISVFPDGQLGDARAIIDGVQKGTIDMSFTATGAMAAFSPIFQVLDLPFLFPSYEAAYTYVDGENGRKLLARLDKSGMHGLVFLENGWKNFTNSWKEIKRPEDFNGMKIRVTQNQLATRIISTLGAKPLPLTYLELPNALQKKFVDGQDNPTVNIYSSKMYESQPWMTQSQHIYNVMIIKINKKTWDSLPKNLQIILEDTALEIRGFQRKLNRECDDAFIGKLKSKGMKIHVLTPSEKQLFEQALLPVYDWARGVIGSSWIDNALQFRKEWDAGKFKRQEQKYISDYKKISVPVKETMANFK
jgi:tripartite ATP-independent transporter DctP family solute receptor